MAAQPHPAFFYATSELINHTDSNDIIIVDAQFIVAIKLVDFIIDKRGHIFVEIVYKYR